MKYRTFESNDNYFKFYNQVKDTIKILSFRILKDCIKIKYKEVGKE